MKDLPSSTLALPPVALTRAGSAVTRVNRRGSGASGHVSVRALEAALQAVMGLDLLPGGNPALLTGPDRVDARRLLRTELADPDPDGEPELARSGASGRRS